MNRPTTTMSTEDSKTVQHDAHHEGGVSSDEEAGVFKGQIDPVYEAKANVLNRAVSPIPLQGPFSLQQYTVVCTR
jgi:hypothetical protein